MSGGELASLASQSTNPQHDGEACFVCGQNATFRFTCSKCKGKGKGKGSHMLCPKCRYGDYRHCKICDAPVGDDDFRTDSDLQSISPGEHGHHSTPVAESVGYRGRVLALECSKCKCKLERLSQKIQMLEQQAADKDEYVKKALADKDAYVKKTLETNGKYTKALEDELETKDNLILTLEAKINELEQHAKAAPRASAQQLPSRRPPITTSSGASSSASPHPAPEQPQQDVPPGVTSEVGDDIPAPSPTVEDMPCVSNQCRKVESIDHDLLSKLGRDLGQSLGEQNVGVQYVQRAWDKTGVDLTLKFMDDERMNRTFSGTGKDRNTALEEARKAASNEKRRLTVARSRPESGIVERRVKLKGVPVGRAIGTDGKMKTNLRNVSGCDCSFGTDRDGDHSVLIRGLTDQIPFAIALGYVVVQLSSAGIEYIDKQVDKSFYELVKVPMGTDGCIRNYVNGIDYGTLNRFGYDHNVLVFQLAEGSSEAEQCYAIFGNDKEPRLKAKLDLLGTAELKVPGSFPHLCSETESNEPFASMDVLRIDGRTDTLKYLTGKNGDTRILKIENPSASRVRFFQAPCGEGLYAFIVGDFAQRQGARLCLKWLLDSEHNNGPFIDHPKQEWVDLGFVEPLPLSKAEKGSLLLNKAQKLKDMERELCVRMAFLDAKKGGGSDNITLFIFSSKGDDRGRAVNALKNGLSAVCA